MAQIANIVLVISLVLQGVAILIALFVPFGFDHPSSLGLDFDHFIILFAIHSIVLIIGIVAAMVSQRFGLAFGQLAVTGILVFLGFTGWLGI